MKTEQWEYITNNWGTTDPVIMEQIAAIKDEDALAAKAAEEAIADRDKTIRELTQQNVDLNKTNMNLILRLTDPALAGDKGDEEEDDDDVVKTTDYDEFVTID